MTYTIVARDPKTNALGIASATGNLAVGGFVPHLKPGIGVIATQGFSTNYWYGINGLSLLESGKRATAKRRPGPGIKTALKPPILLNATLYWAVICWPIPMCQA